MKKTFGILVLVTTVILFFYPDIKAQTVDIELSVDSHNMITVVPDSCPVDTGSYVKFTTKDNNKTFVVIIDNYDGFFETPINPLIIMVTKRNPAAFQIGTPPKGDTIKYYSVGVQTTADTEPPLPPEAPPKIVLKTN